MTMTSSITPPEANAAEQSRMELQARLNGLGGLNGRKLDPEAKAKKLREACEGFESIFIQKMWQEMRNTVPKSGLLSGRDEKMWQDMYDQELSKSMTKAGGIGLADMMYEQLSRGLADASSSAAQTVTGSAFVPTAAPLIMPVAEEMREPSPVRTMPASSIYETEAPQTAAMPEVEASPEVKEQVAPVMRPVEHRQNLRHAETQTVQPGSREHTVSVNNGIQQAYAAKREAGDKLGSRGVRPSLRASKTQQQGRQAEAAVETPQNFAPGSAQSLEAALNLAKAGGAAQPAAQVTSIGDMVNAAKARNAAQASQSAQNAASVQKVTEEGQSTQPVVKKVTYTTNIPRAKNAKAAKDGIGKDAIRMLNVDNISVNSKQGSGLAAYHAQQAAARQEQNTLQAPQNIEQAPVMPSQVEQSGQERQAASIASLTAASAGKAGQDDMNFAIPPLKPADLKS